MMTPNMVTTQSAFEEKAETIRKAMKEAGEQMLIAVIPEGEFDAERMKKILRENADLSKKVDNLTDAIADLRHESHKEKMELKQIIEDRDKRISELERTISWLAPKAALADQK